MATLVLGLAGQAIGASIGGSILGISAVQIGGLIGTAIGGSFGPTTHNEGPRLDNLKVMSSAEGAAIPQIFGRFRTAGEIIWATDFREESTTTKHGGKGGGPKVKNTEYSYFASFAVALCEGEIGGISRVWANGEQLDLSNITWRWYRGDEQQLPDPLIVAKNGSFPTSGFRGTAYVVFEDLALADFGNRLPQLSFEVMRPLPAADNAEGMVGAVCLIPGSGEVTLSNEVISWDGGYGQGSAENVHAQSGTPDLLLSLDQLQGLAPSVQNVSLVVSWFGDDLRASDCKFRPCVDRMDKVLTPKAWQVNGISRAGAQLVSQDDDGRPNFGGTPADFSVIQAIEELRERGLETTFYPFIMMDIAATNSLPNPYSDNAASVGQPAFPWRGRISCSPAAGFAATVDKTAAAALQVASIFGTAQVSDFTISGQNVSWNGAAGDWGLRRMILHYAHLCAAAGGVDAFLIGSEMRELTQIRDGAGNYPAVAEYINLAAAVRTILGPSCKISYAADWSEYFGHQPGDGSGDVNFHLDDLWAAANIDFVGIDNYMPLSDWRDGWDHIDAQSWPTIYDQGYLRSNISGGEGYDWYYASAADRDNQARSAITDGAYGKPWIYRPKDIRSWWLNAHFNRPGGVESGTQTAWVPQSKPIVFTELGCPAVDRGTNQPNVFYDAKSSESFLPYHSRGWRDDAIQRAYLEASFGFWADPVNNPASNSYGQPMVDLPSCSVWTWDARPYPFFPELADVWSDGTNWRLGHWLNGRLGSVSLASLVRHLCLSAGVPAQQINVSGLWGAIEGYAIASLQSPIASIEILARHFGFDAFESNGQLLFNMRGRGAALTLTPDDMVADQQNPKGFELVRGQETELPQAIKWQLARSDESYDPIQVEARRQLVSSTRISAQSFPFATPPQEAERRCKRELTETWLGIETASFSLPPSKLALDPGDVIGFENDGRVLFYHINSATDTSSRQLETNRYERESYDLPPGMGRNASLHSPASFAAPQFKLLDLPQLNEDYTAHRPLISTWSRPWSGELGIYYGTDPADLAFSTSVTSRSGMGVLAADLAPGPVALFDRGNEVLLDLFEGSLQSVGDIALFSGDNSFAIQTDAGWEILQAGDVTLVSPGRYRLTKLLRGQRGSELQMGSPAVAGSVVVLLDSRLKELPLALNDIGTSRSWHALPAGADAGFTTSLDFTAQGRGLVPFSPCHLAATKAGGLSDIDLKWIRRDRAPAADSWVLQVPMSEVTEAYDLEILSADASTVVRTLTGLTAPEWTYVEANQIADFGAVISTINIRVYQIGALGRGDKAEAELEITT